MEKTASYNKHICSQVFFQGSNPIKISPSSSNIFADQIQFRSITETQSPAAFFYTGAKTRAGGAAEEETLTLISQDKWQFLGIGF